MHFIQISVILPLLGKTSSLLQEIVKLFRLFIKLRLGRLDLLVNFIDFFVDDLDLDVGVSFIFDHDIQLILLVLHAP